MGKKRGVFEEFKTFISRGSVVDLAVGMIIGVAFTAIVSSLVNDIVMPIVGTVLGGINFTNLKIIIRDATETHKELAIAYGNFIQSVVDFLLIAVVVFLMVRLINTFREKSESLLKHKEEQEITVTEAKPTELEILIEIRDLLKNGK
ncbi:MAG: large-conductance mechanosensitive channel protein MscL [Sphaerochaetaceae bacterium]